MGEARFTPGPWVLAKNNPLIIIPEYVPLPAICKVYTVRRPDVSNEANAHLIVAAPELYAELERLLVRFENCCRHAGNSYEAIADATLSTRQLLAKARGESP